MTIRRKMCKEALSLIGNGHWTLMLDFSWSNDAIEDDIVDKHLLEAKRDAKANLVTKRFKVCSVAFRSWHYLIQI